MTESSASLSQQEFVAFDLETTGLSRQQGQIVEFGAVRFRSDGTELGRLTLLANPGCPIPRAAWRVHGISDAMVRNQPPVEAVLPRFLDFLGSPRTVLLAHNASFDVGFLRMALARHALPPPAHSVFDNLRLARVRLPELASHRLESLAAALRAAPRVEHRALADALLLKTVFLHAVHRAPAVPSLDELRRLAPPLHLTRGKGDPPRHEPAFPAGRCDAGAAIAESDEHHRRLRAAIEMRLPMTIVYDGGSKGPVERSITPRILVQSQGVTYLRAFCHVDLREKVYRVDRIRTLRAAATAEPWR